MAERLDAASRGRVSRPACERHGGWHGYRRAAKAGAGAARPRRRGTAAEGSAAASSARPARSTSGRTSGGRCSTTGRGRIRSASTTRAASPSASIRMCGSTGPSHRAPSSASPAGGPGGPRTCSTSSATRWSTTWRCRSRLGEHELLEARRSRRGVELWFRFPTGADTHSAVEGFFFDGVGLARTPRLPASRSWARSSMAPT